MNIAMFFSSKKMPYLIFFLVLSIYGLSLYNNSFFFWDDRWMIVNNPTIRLTSWENFLEIFTQSYQSQYSPVNTLLYILTYTLFGLDPFFFKLICIILHLINCLLVYKFIIQLITVKGNKSIAEIDQSEWFIIYMVTLLFGISPMQIEVVAWSSASKISLFSLFFLLSIIYYIKFVTEGKGLLLVLSIVFFIISYGAKEQAVILPICIIVTHFYLFSKIEKRSWAYLLLFLIIGGLFGLISIWIQNVGFGEQINYKYYPLTQRIFLASYSITQYIVKILLPLRQWSYYPFPMLPGEDLPFIYYIYPITIFFLFYYCFIINKESYIHYGFLFFLLNIVLTLHIIPMARYSVIADRYVYLACIGLFFIVAKKVSEEVFRESNSEKRNKIFGVCILLYIIFTYVKSIYYIIEWSNFWLDKSV